MGVIGGRLVIVRGAKVNSASLKPLSVWVTSRRIMLNPTENNNNGNDNEKMDKMHLHYAHTDLRKDYRWTAKECYEYMYGKDWGVVNQYYSELVNGRSLLSDLFQAKHGQSDGDIVESFDEFAPKTSLSDGQSGRWARLTFKIVVSYHGEYFDGWQKQPGLNTVQGLIERSIGTFVDDRKVEQLKAKGLPIEGMTVVAGRTDKGVTALNQVCSFYTWRKDVKVEDIKCAINMTAPGKLQVVSVSQVSRAFHPNFGAKWRRYLYIFPLGQRDQSKQMDSREETGNVCSDMSRERQRNNSAENNRVEKTDDFLDDKNVIDGVKKPTSFSVARADRLLRQLEGKLLSYKMFARDTKPSRNTGPPTECFLYHARATEASLPCSDKDKTEVRVMCVELVANRFLRRMVRVLVATTVREAAAGSEDDILLKLTEATCRRATAPPAPPDGLCLFDVGYSDFDPSICFIH